MRAFVLSAEGTATLFVGNTSVTLKLEITKENLKYVIYKLEEATKHQILKRAFLVPTVLAIEEMLGIKAVAIDEEPTIQSELL